MTEQVQTEDYTKLFYQRAASTLRIHGILSIIFGGLGVLGALLFTLLLTFGASSGAEFGEYDDTGIGLLAMSIVILMLWTLPHIYLIIAGTHLIREPASKLAKTLIIINLIVGVFWNLVLLIFAIINLTQLSDYERGYDLHKTKK